MNRWISRFAIGTFVYYLATFAFETGFFWSIGLEHMSAFGTSEHTMHAAAYIVGVAGAFAFLYVAGLMPAFLMGPHTVAVPTAPPVHDAGREQPRRWLPTLMQAPALLLFAVIFVTFCVEAVASGLSPATLFPILAAGTGTVYMLEQVGLIERHLWLAPAGLTAVLSPFALGEAVFNRQVATARGVPIRIGDRQIVGQPLFLGTERLVLATRKGIYLADKDRQFVVRISGRF